MESYTIRILYRNRNNPEKFVGVVEGTEDTMARGFVGMKGLWRILSSPDPGQGRGKVVAPVTDGRRPREELIDLFQSMREE